MNDHATFQAPAVSGPGGSSGVEVTLNLNARQYLDQTAPWVRFLSVLIFVCAGLLVLVGFGMMLASVAGRLVPAGLDTGRGAFPGAIAGIIGGLIYLLMAAAYIAPGVFLSRYAAAIRVLRSTQTAGALEDALKHQRSFWRYVGIMTLVGIAITVLGLVIFLVAMTFILTRRF